MEMAEPSAKFIELDMVLESTLSWMLTHFSTVKLSISDFSDFLQEQCLRVTIDVMDQHDQKQLVSHSPKAVRAGTWRLR